MAKIDHHLHTSRHSPDSILDPDDLIEEALRCGLDAVVITEHDYQWTADELAKLNRRSKGLLVLSGAEVSAREGHFLVYGLPDLSEAHPGIEVKKLVELVRRHDAAIVAAHPFRWDQDFRAIAEACSGDFDAIELVSKNVTLQTRAKSESVLKTYPAMGRTGSSDGHEQETIGCYYTEFPGAICTISEFVEALRTRSGQPRACAGKFHAAGEIR